MSSNPDDRRVGRFAAFRKLGAPRRGRLSVVLQLTPTDCGAACLSMVLDYHGKRLPIDDVRSAVGAGKHGVTAKRILDAAEHFGLRARGVKVSLDNAAFLPAGTILHWEMNHFVVLEAMAADGVRILDPAIGTRKISLTDFSKLFTGIALLLEPSATFVPEELRPKTRWARYKGWVLAAPGYFSRIIVASLLLQLVALSGPVVMGLTVDRIVPRHDAHLLQLLAAGLCVMLSFQFLTTLLRSHLLLHLRTYADAEMSLQFLEHLLDLPFSFFQERSAGDLVMRLSSGAQIRELLTSGAMSALLDGVMVLLYFALLMLAAPFLGLLALVIAALQALVYLAVGRRNRELMAEQLATQAKLSGFQVEMLAGIESVKAMGAEARLTERWSELYVDVLNASLDRGRLAANFGTVMGGLGFVGPLLLLMVGAQMVLDGQLSVGSMLALSSLGAGFLGPIGSLVSTAMQLETLQGYMARVEDVLDAKTERRTDAGLASAELLGQVELERVSFRYTVDGPLVVSDVSLRVMPGECLAIVGASGSGKSTLARLLGGLYTPTSGVVAYDGIPLSRWDPPTLRRRLGMVTQDTRLFAAPIRENIALLDGTVPLAEIETAAKLAQIHDDIASLPMGYDTVLSDGGSSLSGGQRQRLALARALLHRPAIVVLDEATSALDTLTERRIQAELTALRCTRILIAHRLSSIVDAERIVVLERGHVVAVGTHHELLVSCELYAALVKAQASPTS
jgi:ABC-type bacteriocin/lantibiotic exporter with double-glycine peptidase domain